MADRSTEPSPTIGAKLRYLFDRRRRPDGKPYTLSEVAEALEAAGGPGVGQAYLSRLRRYSERDLALSADRRAALAWFFQVDPSYFDPDCPVDQPPWLALRAGPEPSSAPHAADDELCLRIYGRALGMSPMQRDVWLKMAEAAKRIAPDPQVSDEPAPPLPPSLRRRSRDE